VLRRKLFWLHELNTRFAIVQQPSCMIADVGFLNTLGQRTASWSVLTVIRINLLVALLE